MTYALRSCLALALLGCGSPPSHAAAPVTTLVPPPASLLRSAGPEPMQIAHVYAKGCAFAAISTESVSVSFDASEPEATFAIVQTPTPVKLVLGASAGEPSSVQLEIYALSLDAQVPEDGVPLHAHAPLGLAGVYDPTSEIHIHWNLSQHASPRAGDTPGFEASTLAADRMSAVSKRVTCAEVGLDVRPFVQRRLPKRSGSRIAIEDLALAPSADAAPTAQIPSGTFVTTHARSKDKTEISLLRNGLWHGWVSSSSLGKSTAPFTPLRAVGPRLALITRFYDSTCPAELPLYVRERASTRAPVRVGSVRADTHVAFEPAHDGPYRALRDDQRSAANYRGELSLQRGYELVVDQAASAACVDENPP